MRPERRMMAYRRWYERGSGVVKNADCLKAPKIDERAVKLINLVLMESIRASENSL